MQKTNGWKRCAATRSRERDTPRITAWGEGVIASMALRFAKTAMHTLAAVLILTIPSFAQQKLPNIFTVSNVRAEADAADSVEAKRLATLNAETRAFWLLMSRLADFRALARVPQLSPEQVQRL